MKKSKGDFMKYVFSEGELSNIDSATPLNSWESYPPWHHVMNYNGGGLGRLQNLFDIANERGLNTKNFDHFLNDNKDA
tara:strand:- start:1519 stop:1752 length:234 start_codon:yes stop_codon:yes gene_type:complete